MKFRIKKITSTNALGEELEEYKIERKLLFFWKRYRMDFAYFLYNQDGLCYVVSNSASFKSKEEAVTAKKLLKNPDIIKYKSKVIKKLLIKGTSETVYVNLSSIEYNFRPEVNLQKIIWHRFEKESIDSLKEFIDLDRDRELKLNIKKVKSIIIDD